MKTIFLLIPLNDHCREWLGENVNIDFMIGHTIPVETNYIGPIIEGLIEADFNINEDFNIV